MTMRTSGILAAAILIAAALPARAQQTYPTPEAAVKDLVDSAKAKTPGFGDRILGKEGAALLRSGDPDEDAAEPEGVQRSGGRADRDRRRPQWRKAAAGRKQRLDAAAAAREDRRRLEVRRRPGQGGDDQPPDRLRRAQRDRGVRALRGGPGRIFQAGSRRQRTARIRDQVHLDARASTTASTGRRKARPTFRRSTASSRTPTSPSARTKSRSPITATTSGSSPRRGRRRRAAPIPTSSTAT